MSHAESITNYTTAAACALIYQAASAPLSRLLLPPPTSVVVKLNIACANNGDAPLFIADSAAAASQKPKSTRVYVFVGPHGAV
jgi:hypothetical protein